MDRWEEVSFRERCVENPRLPHGPRYFGVDELKDLMEIDEEGIYITEKKKMMVLDDKKKYRLEAIES